MQECVFHCLGRIKFFMVRFSSKPAVSIFLQIRIGQINYFFHHPQNCISCLFPISIIKNQASISQNFHRQPQIHFGEYQLESN